MIASQLQNQQQLDQMEAARQQARQQAASLAMIRLGAQIATTPPVQPAPPSPSAGTPVCADFWGTLGPC